MCGKLYPVVEVKIEKHISKQHKKITNQRTN